MADPKAHRTLVKSPPELWALISEGDALARPLGEFGEIRITRLEPETAVAWEGDTARGTVELEPSGWGTKVTITAMPVAEVPSDPVPEPELPADPAPQPELPADPADPPAPETDDPDPAPAPDPDTAAAAPRRGFFSRLFTRRAPATAAAPEPEAEAEPSPEPEAVAPPEPAAPPEPVAPPEPEPAVATGLDDERIVGILTAALDDLGAAHHRPYSRS